MTATAPVSRMKVRPRTWAAVAAWSFGGLAAVILVPPLIASFPELSARAGGHKLHGVDWALFASQSLILRIHVISVSLAVVLGGVMMAGVKGRRFHRIAGWTWTCLVVVGAVSAIGMGIASQRWNWIQLTVPFTLLLLTAGILAARRHDVVRHRRHMMWLYYSPIVGSAALTFLPGRLMWRLIFS